MPRRKDREGAIIAFFDEAAIASARTLLNIITGRVKAREKSADIAKQIFESHEKRQIALEDASAGRVIPLGAA